MQVLDVGKNLLLGGKSNRLESAIESDCRDDAHEAGWTSRKMNGLGFNSWPDRLFIPPRKSDYGRTFWVEFKKPGEEPTDAQARMIGELRERGEVVYVLDDREVFRKVLRYEATHAKR